MKLDRLKAWLKKRNDRDAALAIAAVLIAWTLLGKNVGALANFISMLIMVALFGSLALAFAGVALLVRKKMKEE